MQTHTNNSNPPMGVDGNAVHSTVASSASSVPQSTVVTTAANSTPAQTNNNNNTQQQQQQQQTALTTHNNNFTAYLPSVPGASVVTAGGLPSTSGFVPAAAQTTSPMMYAYNPQATTYANIAQPIAYLPTLTTGGASHGYAPMQPAFGPGGYMMAGQTSYPQPTYPTYMHFPTQTQQTMHRQFPTAYPVPIRLTPNNNPTTTTASGGALDSGLMPVSSLDATAYQMQQISHHHQQQQQHLAQYHMQQMQFQTVQHQQNMMQLQGPAMTPVMMTPSQPSFTNTSQTTIAATTEEADLIASLANKKLTKSHSVAKSRAVQSTKRSPQLAAVRQHPLHVEMDVGEPPEEEDHEDDGLMMEAVSGEGGVSGYHMKRESIDEDGMEAGEDEEHYEDEEELDEADEFDEEDEYDDGAMEDVKPKSKSRKSKSSDAHAIPADQQSIIICGIPGPGGERIFFEKSDYFGCEVDVYTAKNDPEQRTLYRASALAHKFQVATNQVGMYLVRRRQRNWVPCLYQAMSFEAKPPGRTGLKAGGYFVGLDLCKEFEAYMTSHAKHSRHRTKSSSRRVKEAASRAAQERAQQAAAAAAAMAAANQQSASRSTAYSAPATPDLKAKNSRAIVKVRKPSAEPGPLMQRPASELAMRPGTLPPSHAPTAAAIVRPTSAASMRSPTKAFRQVTASVKVQSSQDQSANMPAFLLHEFASTVSLQSASSTHSHVSQSLSSLKRKSMDCTDSGVMALARHTPDSPHRALTQATEHLSVSGGEPAANAPSTIGSARQPLVRPTIDIYQRESTPQEMYRSSFSSAIKLGPDEELTDFSFGTSAASSAASSTANSQVGTPIHSTLRLKMLTQRPSSKASNLTNAGYVSFPPTHPPLPPSLPSSGQSSPYASAAPPTTATTVPSSPFSLHSSLSGSPAPGHETTIQQQAQPSSPTSPYPRPNSTHRVLPVSTYVKFTAIREGRSSSLPESLVGAPGVSEIIRNLTETSDGSPPSKRQSLPKPTSPHDSVIPSNNTAPVVTHMDLTALSSIHATTTPSASTETSVPMDTTQK